MCVCVRQRERGELERDIKCTFITWVMIEVVCENRCLVCDLCDSSDLAPGPVCSLPSTRRVLGLRGGGAEGGRNERVLSILLHPRPLRPPALLIHIAVLQSRHRSIRQMGNKRLRRLRTCPGLTAREWKAHSLSPAQAQAADSWNSNKRLFHRFHKFENP